MHINTRTEIYVGNLHLKHHSTEPNLPKKVVAPVTASLPPNGFNMLQAQQLFKDLSL